MTSLQLSFCPIDFYHQAKVRGNALCLPHRPVQFSLAAQSCLTVCDSMDCSMPGFPVHHQLPELAQILDHQVGDVFQPSHPLSSPAPPAFSLSQNQGHFQWISSSNQVAKVLELQFQHQSYQWIFRIDFLWDDWFDVLAVKGIFSNTTVQKNQFFSTQHSLWSDSHIHTWLWLYGPYLWLYGPLLAK